MAGHVVGWDCRPRQDELTRCLPVVDGASHVVPQRRRELPLVQQSWDGPVQQKGGIDGGRFLGIGVDIQANLTGGHLSSGLSLSAGLGPFDHDGPNRAQEFGQLTIDGSR
jgi:hypothetical protein